MYTYLGNDQHSSSVGVHSLPYTHNVFAPGQLTCVLPLSIRQPRTQGSIARKVDRFTVVDILAEPAQTSAIICATRRPD